LGAFSTALYQKDAGRYGIRSADEDAKGSWHTCDYLVVLTSRIASLFFRGYVLPLGKLEYAYSEYPWKLLSVIRKSSRFKIAQKLEYRKHAAVNCLGYR